MTVTSGAAGAFAADANLTPAYGAGAPVTSWRRRLEFANRRLTVRDTFQLTTGTSAIYQTQVPTLPTISGMSVTTARMQMRVLAPAGATINAVPTGGGHYRIEVRGSTTGYTVEYTEI